MQENEADMEVNIEFEKIENEEEEDKEEEDLLGPGSWNGSLQ